MRCPECGGQVITAVDVGRVCVAERKVAAGWR